MAPWAQMCKRHPLIRLSTVRGKTRVGTSQIWKPIIVLCANTSRERADNLLPFILLWKPGSGEPAAGREEWTDQLELKLLSLKSGGSISKFHPINSINNSYTASQLMVLTGNLRRCHPLVLHSDQTFTLPALNVPSIFQPVCEVFSDVVWKSYELCALRVHHSTTQRLQLEEETFPFSNHNQWLTLRFCTLLYKVMCDIADTVNSTLLPCCPENKFHCPGSQCSLKKRENNEKHIVFILCA